MEITGKLVFFTRRQLAGSIAEMDLGEYELLQSLVQQEIKEDLNQKSVVRSYNDILFLRLNREPVN